MDNCRLIELTSHGDNRGSLIALEKEHDVPFDIKRVFYIYDTKRGTPRVSMQIKNQSRCLYV